MCHEGRYFENLNNNQALPGGVFLPPLPVLVKSSPDHGPSLSRLGFQRPWYGLITALAVLYLDYWNHHTQGGRRIIRAEWEAAA